jgi:hypothetical protein
MTLMHMLTLILTLALQSATPGFTPDQLWQSWSEERFVQTPAPCLQPAELTAELQRLAELYPGKIRLEEIGRSVEGRPVHLVSFGDGPRTVLLWSQMHGDEPSATPALLDIAHFLLSRADEPAAAAILDDLTLLMIPMLNPDGSEIYERRNLQAVDINRDALQLTTPEGQILKGIRDEYEPMLGFNLHDQSRRTAVGDTGVLATNSVYAVSGDAEGTVTPGRLLAKRACSAIAVTLAPFMPGGMARYDEDWSPRAFGDNITAWGTPVVLIESGGLPPGRDFEDLTRLNFVAILTVLQDLVRNDLQDYDPQIYEDLPRNQSDAWVDVVVRGGSMQQPRNGPSYRADLAFNIEVDDRELAGCATGRDPRAYIADVGDLRFLGAGQIVDAGQGLLVVPFAAGVEGWKARRWLSDEVLADVARLGVGTVFWKVSPREIDAAKVLADGLAGAGRARLEVVSKQAEMPWLTLTGPPGRAKSDALPDVVEALVGTKGGMQGKSPLILDQLCWVPESGARQPVLRLGRPASFLILAPATEGGIDPEIARLSSVFMDGIDVKEGSY